MARLVALVVVFLAFTAYSVEVVVTQGFAALFASHAQFGWESQVFLDLVLAVTAFNLLAWPDAKRRGIAYAPYLVATIALGSIGVLAYLIHREVRALRSREAALA
jgi:hypothetical protein